MDFIQAHKTMGLYTDQVQEHAGKLFQGYVETAESVSGKTKDVASRDAAQDISFVRKSYDLKRFFLFCFAPDLKKYVPSRLNHARPQKGSFGSEDKAQWRFPQEVQYSEYRHRCRVVSMSLSRSEII